MKNNLKDLYLPMRGDLRIRVRDAKTDAVLRRIQIKNTITYKALKALVHLLAQVTGDTVGNFKVTGLHVGTGATPPDRTQTALVTEVAIIALSDVPSEDKFITDSGPYELKILATLEASVGNGNTLQEAGLFLVNGDMMARQVHPGIAKTAAIVIDYDWRIEFTA